MTSDELIQTALTEDLPDGDVTTNSLQIEEYMGRARLIAKEDLVLSGSSLFSKTLLMMDPKLILEWHFKDGDLILDQQTVCTVQGNLISLIKAERVALNFIGYLSGIATLTRCFTKAISHTECKIFDTRKILPGYRALAKQAVLDGGAVNHRTNLSEAILIKENHLTIGHGIKKTIERIKDSSSLPIEIEVKSFHEATLAVECGVQRILLDNMNLKEMEDCLNVIPRHIETEASGNMTLDRVPKVAELGVHYISVGMITHSAPCADLSLILFDD